MKHISKEFVCFMSKQKPYKHLPERVIKEVLLTQYWNVGDYISSDWEWVFEGDTEYKDYLKHEIETGYLKESDVFLEML